ncbi:MAG: hypothetical protein R3C53_01035 [Pirellulaceae bacterium]
MSQNLNRAFMKAYDRERSSQTQRERAAAEQKTQQESELIMRFDTTNVTIPEPHFLNPKRPTARIAVEAIATPVRQPTVAHAPVDQPTRPVIAEGSPLQTDLVQEKSEAALRESIASQMLQAGGWEDQQIDAFIGGFPMLSPRLAAATPVSNESVNDITAKPIPAAEPTLSAPQGPALSNEVQPTELAATRTEQLEAQLQQHSRDGGIFRLDRPSYSTAPLNASGSTNTQRHRDACQPTLRTSRSQQR